MGLHSMAKLTSLLMASVAAVLLFARNAEAQAAFSRNRAPASSSGSGSDRGLYFGLGILNHNAGQASTSATNASKPYFGEVYPQATFTGMFKIDEEWAIAPSVSYGYPKKTTPEDLMTTNTAFLGVRAHRMLFFDGFDVHFGTGVLYYMMKGKGNAITLNNGSGTSTFGGPTENRTSTLIALDLGLGYQLGDFRLDGSFIVTNVLSSTKRSYSSILSLSMEVW